MVVFMQGCLDLDQQNTDASNRSLGAAQRVRRRDPKALHDENVCIVQIIRSSRKILCNSFRFEAMRFSRIGGSGAIQAVMRCQRSDPGHCFDPDF
jgi:hypothetical protein